MALLRAEILNRDFIEKVLRQCEGTSRISVSALRIGKAEQRGSLLEERLSVGVEAVVRGRQKEYEWIAKVLRPEAGPANYARFQGILETEVSFYVELLPELIQLKTPLPRTFGLLWGDSKTLNREILLLENPEHLGFEPAINLQKQGLDLGHVILVVEWLAKFHALSYVLMRRHKESNRHDAPSWIDQHRWVRRGNDDQLAFHQESDELDLDEKDTSEGGSNLRKRLLTMVATCLKSEATGDHKRIESLIERQDWLDNLKLQTLNESGKRETDFVTLCHGEPWIGCIYFRYEPEVDKSADQEQQQPCPMEVALTDFHALSLGRPGIDIAHFLLTSTTREFRKNHLETVLQIYLTELEDIVISQGYGPGFYTSTDLRSDYRRGLVSGITFCLFAMPMLASASDADEVDTGSDFPAGAVDDSIFWSGSGVLERIVDGLSDVADMMENKL